VSLIFLLCFALLCPAQSALLRQRQDKQKEKKAMPLTTSISCIRWKEMRDGIQVYRLRQRDGVEEQEDLGKSAKAGQMAVMQSAASRVFTNVQVPSPLLPLFYNLSRLSHLPLGNHLLMLSSCQSPSELAYHPRLLAEALTDRIARYSSYHHYS
jgi:hypothetical protein